MPRATTPSPTGRRDNQQTRVYRAEKMSQHLLLGDYWTQSMTELQVLELMETALNHPSVIARWGDHHHASVTFPAKGKTGWAERGTGRIHLPPGTRNPLTVLHEIAHLLPTRTTEADHGPGFVAIYRYLVRLALGEQPAQVLDAAFTSLGVTSDDTQIPPVKPDKASAHRAHEQDIPGVLPGQAGDAAEVLRLAAYAGVFGEPGDQLRSDAFTIARRLRALEDRTGGKPTPSLRIPETVTVPVANLLRTNSRDDVAELVLGAVRKNMTPTTLTAPPPVGKPKKRTKKQTKKRTKKNTKKTGTP